MRKLALYVGPKTDGEFKLYKITHDNEELPPFSSDLHYAVLAEGHSLFGRLSIHLTKEGEIK